MRAQCRWGRRCCRNSISTVTHNAQTDTHHFERTHWVQQARKKARRSLLARVQRTRLGPEQKAAHPHRAQMRVDSPRQRPVPAQEVQRAAAAGAAQDWTLSLHARAMDQEAVGVAHV